MYKYDERTADMYKHINPRFNKPIREHLKWVDIKRNGMPNGERMTVKAQDIKGNEFTFATTGHMGVQEILDTLIKGLKS